MMTHIFQMGWLKPPSSDIGLFKYKFLGEIAWLFCLNRQLAVEFGDKSLVKYLVKHHPK